MSPSHASRRRQSPPSPPSTRSVRGLWLCLLGVAMLCAFGLRLSHMLFVQHVVCEHGQLVDARPTEAHDALHVVTQAPQADLEQGSPASCAHDHCDAFALHHRVGVEVPGPIFGPAPDYIELSFAEPSEPTTASSPLDYAPKNSPPAWVAAA